MTFWLWQTGVRGSPSISSVESRWMSQVLKSLECQVMKTWGQTKTKKTKHAHSQMSISDAHVITVSCCWSTVPWNGLILHLRYMQLKKGIWAAKYRQPHYHAVEQQGDSGTLSTRCIFLFISCCGNKKPALRGLPKSSRHIVLRTLN